MDPQQYRGLSIHFLGGQSIGDLGLRQLCEDLRFAEDLHGFHALVHPRLVGEQLGKAARRLRAALCLDLLEVDLGVDVGSNRQGEPKQCALSLIQ